jgi:hypothetical protein
MVIMQRDKLHAAYGDVMKEVLDEDMFKNREFDN